DDVVSKIEDIEIDLLNNSSSVIACTKSDAEQFLSLALADLQPIICPNGVSEFTKNSEVAILRNQLKKKLGDKKYALFVGSAYPPNAQGFWDNLGHSMGWLSMDEFIFSVGGCSNILEHFMPKNRDISSYVNFDKIKRLGFVTDNELTALIQEASVIILPISDGGGSNLKTAEAILSGKPVVATKMACRGYDRIAEYSNFSIREPGTDFINEVKRYLQLVPDELSVKELELRKEVTWEHALSSLGMIINT
ncbi:glycosyltransferase, partial [Vibrio cholerae]